MDHTAVVLTALAVFFALPFPAWLSRSQWPLRAPRAAIFLWQSTALAAILSAFGAGLAIASMLFVPGPDGRPTSSPADAMVTLGWPLWVALVLVFALTLLIGARLMFSVVSVAIRTRQRRDRHRMIVDLLDCEESSEHLHQNIRVLATDQPLAYCLPGSRPRVVLSQGTLSALDANAVSAIVHHERCHLRERHDILLEAFVAMHRAFPRVVRSKAALQSVQLLVELLADDNAVKHAGRGPLARALVACAGGSVPAGALAAGGRSTLLRIRRLHSSGAGAALSPNPRVSAAAYLASAAILVVPTLAVALPWLIELNRLLLG
ncbi:M56 family metallopeptidase [Smaragdicoccus niigatensis]|uniref:M56 family metallopeptidase n=1 Tax=Smaragdicoccus niigatensis TaxID=359359 RepID=UPI00037030D9|nr:M56 family metallopeptidase [Smaragdicoccus niigatensis]